MFPFASPRVGGVVRKTMRQVKREICSHLEEEGIEATDDVVKEVLDTMAWTGKCALGAIVQLFFED
jgi:hypothetical protein